MSDQDHLEDPFGLLSSEELIQIQQEYRKKKLKETLVGPLISTGFHVLLVFAATFYKVEPKSENPQVELTRAVDEVPPVPPPEQPPIVPPKQPVLTPPTEDEPLHVENTVIDDQPKEIEDISDAHPPATDISNDMSALDNMKPSTSTALSPSMFIGRTPESKQRLRTKHDAGETEESLLKALDWLAKNQRPDGSWGNSGVTGLALLAYLANGDTPQSKRYGKTVSKAIQWLASSSPGAKLVSSEVINSNDRVVGLHDVTQDDFGFYAGGPSAGIGDVRVLHGYPHAIKVYALAEAYLMTGNYSLERPLKAFAATLIKGQKPEGDFDYNYKKGPRWDSSISFWNYQALKALDVIDLEFDGLDEAIARSIPRMKLMAKYHFPYSGTSKPSGGRGNTGLAAAGALCLQLLGAAKGDSHVDNIMGRIRKEAVPQMDWDYSPKKWVMYAWYYQTFAMFQHGGKHWEEWNSAFQKVLIKNQHPEGYWSHELAWGAGKTVEAKAYQTAMSALMFTVYFRYGVQADRATMKKKSKEKVLNEDETIVIF